jgi:hypothetical protein
MWVHFGFNINVARADGGRAADVERRRLKRAPSIIGLQRHSLTPPMLEAILFLKVNRA